MYLYLYKLNAIDTISLFVKYNSKILSYKKILQRLTKFIYLTFFIEFIVFEKYKYIYNFKNFLTLYLSEFFSSSDLSFYVLMLVTTFLV